MSISPTPNRASEGLDHHVPQLGVLIGNVIDIRGRNIVIDASYVPGDNVSRLPASVNGIPWRSAKRGYLYSKSYVLWNGNSSSLPKSTCSAPSRE